MRKKASWRNRVVTVHKPWFLQLIYGNTNLLSKGKQTNMKTQSQWQWLQKGCNAFFDIGRQKQITFLLGLSLYIKCASTQFGDNWQSWLDCRYISQTPQHVLQECPAQIHFWQETCLEVTPVIHRLWGVVQRAYWKQVTSNLQNSIC